MTKLWDPQELAEVLGVTLPGADADEQPNTNGRNASAPGDTEPFRLDDYPKVRAALDHVSDPADRSADTYGVLGACYDAGLTLAQARWAVNQRADLAARLRERNDDDVLACWLKIDSGRRKNTFSDGTDGGGGAETVDDRITHTAHLRMAYELSRWAKDKLLYVHGIGWHYWDGRRWAYDDKGVAKRAVYAMLKALWPKAFGDSDKQKALAKAIVACETAAGVKGVLALAEALKSFAATVADLDADPYLLNCADCTLDLRTGEQRPHNPADGITKVTRAAYHPDTAGAVWTAFLEKVLPDNDIRDYLRRVIGVALLGMVIEHNLDILTGVGGNGKGTLYKAVCFALGDYADMADPDIFLERKSSGHVNEMALRGLRLAVVSESGRGRALDEARMKRLTGGDLINARRHYQEPVTFTPSHLPLFVTNHLPKVSGDDEAVWRRLRVIPFDVVIPDTEQDKHLDEKLQVEADAILAWAIEGWKDYRRRGEKLQEPDGVLVRTAKYRSDSDDVGRFLDDPDWVLKAPTLQATSSQLLAAYRRWAEQEGGDEIGLKEFGQALDTKGYPVTQRTGKGRWRSGIAPNPLSENLGTGCEWGDK